MNNKATNSVFSTRSFLQRPHSYLELFDPYFYPEYLRTFAQFPLYPDYMYPDNNLQYPQYSDLYQIDVPTSTRGQKITYYPPISPNTVLKKSADKKREYNDEKVDASIAGLIELMNKDENLKGKYKITSLYRPGAKTKQQKTSFHSLGKAIDIIPVGCSWDELEQLIMSNSEIVDYMKNNKLGILDEYTTNGRQKRTGATGNHMHIGPDQLALVDFNKLLQKYEIS